MRLPTLALPALSGLPGAVPLCYDCFLSVALSPCGMQRHPRAAWQPPAEEMRSATSHGWAADSPAPVQADESPELPWPLRARGAPGRPQTALDPLPGDELQGRLQELPEQLCETESREREPIGAAREASAGLEEAQAEARLLREKLRDSDAALRAARSRLKEAEAELERKNSSLLDTEASLERAERALAAAEAQCGRADEEASVRERRRAEEQLARAWEASAEAERRADEAKRRAEELRAGETKLLAVIEGYRSDIAELSSRLEGAESECRSLKESLIDANSEKDGLSRAVGRARNETESVRRENRSLRRSIEGQEAQITELQSALEAANEELTELRRRCYWLECQNRAAPVRSSGAGRLPPPPDFHRSWDLEGGAEGRGHAAAGHGLHTDAAAPRPESHRGEDHRREEDGRDISSPRDRCSQQELMVLEHLLRKVKQGSAGDPVNFNNPRGLDVEERKLFHYLIHKVNKTGSREGEEVLRGGAAAEAAPRGSGSPRLGGGGGGASPRQGGRRPANRPPPPYATGGSSGDRPFSAASRGGNDSRLDSLPYGTQDTLQRDTSATQQLEDCLLRLHEEKNQLDAEYARMPLNGGKTIAQRRRKSEIESRLDELQREISTCKLNLKKLGA
uniref:Enkurin domain-containing protein n=2 Tax=Tetraselmis sp. GSL018 TaxID=582737 RepID=A0A061QQA8_9CHLO